MNCRVVNISLPGELLKEVEKAAKREKRTRSEFFREAVRRYMEEKRPSRRMAIETSWSPADRRAFAALSEPSLRRIWDNDKDAIYDSWSPEHHDET